MSFELSNDAAVRVLVDQHRRFRAFLTKRLGNEADADEILQQSFRKAIEHGPEATTAESVVAWFFRVLRNAVTDHYRAKASEARHRDALRIVAQLETEGSEDHAELCQCLGDLLPTLKAEYADVLQRVDLGDESPAQAAERLGIARNALDVRLHRARKALKSSLVRACGTCTEHGCLDCSCRRS